MHQYAHPSGQCRVRALRQDTRDRARQDIARTSSSHPWIATLAKTGYPIGGPYQSTCALQHYCPVITLNQTPEGSEPVVLHFVGLDAQQPACLAGMGSQNPV